MKDLMFFENAKLLAERFKIVPLMYGSLGLEYITDTNMDVDDIDILIPEVFLNEKWEDFKCTLISSGYILIDEQEHTFQKNSICYSYAPVEELKSFAKINLFDIETKINYGIQFRVLSLEQYLKVYTASSKDGYRINVRQKKDRDKILFIQEQLSKQKIIL